MQEGSFSGSVNVRSLSGRTSKEIAADVPVIRPAKNAWDKRRHEQGRTCSIKGCTRPHASKGYCHPHYKLYVLRGGPPRHERVCEHCHTRFIGKRPTTRFCSKVCGDRAFYVRTRNPSP